MTNNEHIHGAITHESGRKDSLVRVTLKAVILDEEGCILVAPKSMSFDAGIDGDEVKFVDARVFEKSDLWAERQIFMYSELAKERIG